MAKGKTKKASKTSTKKKISAPPKGGTRRKSSPKTEHELYQLPNIKSFIEKERRHDELDRLREVRHQKSTWNAIFIACFLMNLIFALFALVGGFFLGN